MAIISSAPQVITELFFRVQFIENGTEVILEIIADCTVVPNLIRESCPESNI